MISVAGRRFGLAAAAAVGILDPMTQVPIARTVKHRGVVVAPRARPLAARLADGFERLGDGPRGFLAALIGLWPVTIACGAGLGICWLAVVSGGP